METQAVPVRSEALVKHYGKVEALRGVTLELGRGVTAVLGENGAGKTTLIKCALGLERPTSGTLRIFDEPPRKRQARQRLGIMLQDTEMPDLLTGRELITLFASYYPRPLSTEEIISLTHVDAFVDKRYKKLSGGQKRRIQFALAIVGDPELVFLDEPTTGLDAEARKALWDTVRGLADAGRSVVLTTHYLEEADALADRVIILKQGRVVADESAATLRARLGGSLIRCQTRLDPDALGRLPACTGQSRSGRMKELRSSDPAATLRALLQQDESVSDLTVSKPRLDDIFTELNR